MVGEIHWTFLTLVKVEYVIWLKYQPPFQTMTFFCWFGHLLHLWVFFFCKVKISQELVCELKEKSLKIKCFFASSIPHSVTYFWNKMKKKTFMIFHSFPPKFLTHISDFPAWFIFLNLLMSCSSLVWDFDRVNIGNPPTNCSSSDMSVGATFHIIQLLANYWFRQKLNMPYRPIMSVDRPKNAPSEESRLGSFFWIIQSVFYFTLKLQAGD